MRNGGTSSTQQTKPTSKSKRTSKDCCRLGVGSKKLIELKSSYILRSPFKILDNKANKYLNLVSKLETLSPLLTLQRGYTMTKKDGKVISSAKKIKKGDKIEVSFTDGEIDAIVE